MSLEFGVFDHIEPVPGLALDEIYRLRLKQLEKLDSAGFYGYHLAEHHTPAVHSLAPSQNVFLAAAAQRTSKIHLGPCIYVLLLPASVGTALFISPYNALVMNTLPENRSFASGMLETTRQMGHTVGTTLAAMVLGISLPATVELMPAVDAQPYYQQGFRFAALIVVWIVAAGAIVALFQRVPVTFRREQPAEPAPQPGGGD